MNRIVQSVVAASLLLVGTNAMANSPPQIISACVTFPTADIARITGMVYDPDWNGHFVGPLPLGVCMDQTEPNIKGMTYVCDVPAQIRGATITLVAADKQYAYSAPVEVKIEPGCTFF